MHITRYVIIRPVRWWCICAFSSLLAVAVIKEQSARTLPSLVTTVLIFRARKCAQKKIIVIRLPGGVPTLTLVRSAPFVYSELILRYCHPAIPEEMKDSTKKGVGRFYKTIGEEFLE